MKKFLALINARNKEFYRDHSTMIWTLLFPFIVLMGFTYGYSGKQEPVLRITAYPAHGASLPMLKPLREVPGLEIVASDDAAAARRKVERYESDLALEIQDEGRSLIYAINDGSDKGKLARRLVLDAFQAQAEPRPSLTERAVEGRRIRYADWLVPGLLAMNIMFGSMFGVGYVIVRYRKNGVLKRLRATPLTAFQFLFAQVVSRMLLMVVTSYMVIGGAMLLIGFRPQGSWVDIGIFLSVSAMAMISVGLLVAARVASEEVAEGVLNLMTWPMMFLSGVWFSLEGASRWVLYGAQAMPLTHVVEGLRAILIDGASLASLGSQVVVLGILSAVFVVISSAIFRWR